MPILAPEGKSVHRLDDRLYLSQARYDSNTMTLKASSPSNSLVSGATFCPNTNLSLTFTVDEAQRVSRDPWPAIAPSTTPGSHKGVCDKAFVVFIVAKPNGVAFGGGDSFHATKDLHDLCGWKGTRSHHREEGVNKDQKRYSSINLRVFIPNNKTSSQARIIMYDNATYNCKVEQLGQKQLQVPAGHHIVATWCRGEMTEVETTDQIMQRIDATIASWK